MKNNNRGFSLVELIVVIAIMAILAAVAVVGFSLYIPKAQQAADKQLVSDIEYALELYYQANPEFEGAEMIVIGLNGTTVSGDENSFLHNFMKDTYGNDYGSVKLQYDSWGNGASVTAEVLQYFQAGQNGDFADVYNGNSVPTFAEDVDELFVEIRDTSKWVADKSTGIEGVDIESGAELLKEAAKYTLAAGDGSFGDVNKFQNAWSNFDTVVNMAGTGDENILDNDAFTAETFGPAVATAAVVKARNVSIATYLQDQNPAYAKYYDAIANLGGTVPTDLAEVVNNSKDPDGNPQLTMIADELGIADDEGFNMEEFAAAFATAQTYFVADGTGSSPAQKDALAYYAMMDTVNSTNSDTSSSDEEYWNEMVGAVNIYGQIASGKLSLEDVLSAYSVEVPENSIAILVVADGNGIEIKVNPSYIVE